MDPYLEREEVWHDFHERFIPYAAEMLATQVEPEYIVKLDEHVYIHELPADQRRLIGKSDVSITRDWEGNRATQSPASVSTPAHAILSGLAVDEERLAYIEVRDRASLEIVTVVELLSPSNKTSDRLQYIAKRTHYLQSGIRLVEIDLLRGGPRMPIAEMPECDYYVLIARPEELPRVGIWPIQLRDRLPVIHVPVREPDRKVSLDLQELLGRVYDAARYKNYLHSKPISPPLTNDDARWARTFVP
jgi:hypothetical protein